MNVPRAEDGEIRTPHLLVGSEGVETIGLTEDELGNRFFLRRLILDYTGAEPGQLGQNVSLVATTEDESGMLRTEDVDTLSFYREI